MKVLEGVRGNFLQEVPPAFSQINPNLQTDFNKMRSSFGLNTLSLVSFALMIVGYIVYRRGFRFKKSDITVMAAGLILACVV